jgi:aspartate aminotransferase-like enzyme
LKPAISHRSEEFLSMLSDVRSNLCRLPGARNVAILQGSGTLANDIVGGQLSLSGEAGLILSNGEFGDRLIDHARRFQLRYATYIVDWGNALDYEAIDRLLNMKPELRWLWCVHCETSTGIMNDLNALKRLARLHDLKLCIDCISSIGAVSLDIAGVHLASAAIGKALGAPPGLSMVFTDGDIAPPGHLPRYLDLASYLSPVVPFTISSNLISALQAALAKATPERNELTAQAGARLRDELVKGGVAIVAPFNTAAPHVLTISLPAHIDSERLAHTLATREVLVAHASTYLKQRNWVQVCLMGEFTAEIIEWATCILLEEINAFRHQVDEMQDSHLGYDLASE